MAEIEERLRRVRPARVAYADAMRRADLLRYELERRLKHLRVAKRRSAPKIVPRWRSLLNRLSHWIRSL